MKSSPTVMNPWILIAAIALAACAGIAALLYMKDAPDTPAPRTRNDSRPLPEKEKPEPAPEVEAEPEPATNPEPGPPEKDPAPSLEKKRGEQARKWWFAWKTTYPRELEKNLHKLSGILDLSPAQMELVRDPFQREERLWAEYLDRKLEPVFAEGKRPDFRSLMSREYRALVDRICADTDSRVHSILSETQWETYSEWRESYNRDRYYWSEGNRRD